MADIKSLGHSLIYKANVNGSPPVGLNVQDDNVSMRTSVRALTGMQKEGLVYDGSTGTSWRMVCDEGPYLNGTDLAPFPLAFYSAGMAFSFTEEFLKHAKAAGVTINHFELTQDNFYTMKGSALRGNMIGGALPVEMAIVVESDADEDVIWQLVSKAEKTSPAQIYMKESLANTFALNHNGVETAVSNVEPSPNPPLPEPTPQLEALQPLPDNTYVPDIILKLDAADTVFGVEGGAGSSLQATQKRTLHVRAICTVRDDGLKEAKVQLFKPLGSNFRFLSDDTGQERAPSSLAYLSVGVGFCFMTQIGRYAHIVKQNLTGYSIVQDTVFGMNADSVTAEPVDTNTFLQTDGEEDEAAQRTLYMSERTCFLHAAIRDSNQTNFKLQVK